MQRLPPLNAIRAFEAAARYLSFAKAADELNVSPGAVSHHIKALEEDLGVPLFKRLNRAVILTEAGQLCLPDIRDAFEKLNLAIDKVRSSKSDNRLRVSVGPAFASKWLLPRLYKFSEAHPEIAVTVSASVGVSDFTADPVDAAIRYGMGEYPGTKSDHLFEEWHVPMCSPQLLEGRKSLKKPRDLENFPILFEDSMASNPLSPTWEHWLEKAGAKDITLTQRAHFNQADHALQAAVDGQGVVLGRYVLASRDLEAGRLVIPIDIRLETPLSYFFVSPKSAVEKPEVTLFRTWLLEAVGQAPRAHPQ
jgi:LysR family glycine cleavage system transcriptional activator